MSDAHDWQELIDRHLRGELSESEQERLAELLDSDAAARKDFVEQVQWDTRLAEVLREVVVRSANQTWTKEPTPIFAERTVDYRQTNTDDKNHQCAAGRCRSHHRGADCEPVFPAGEYQNASDRITVQQPSVDLPIARISGLSGPLQWTGDGGRVTYDLSAGAELSGGTIEGLASGSWFELEFNDGSTATISGNSMLTFSDHGQKVLHLKQGNLSSNVKPQPPGKPMLIYTRSAMLEVLGTQFEVEAERAATTLNVSEGKVRVKRFSDGSTVDVPARHRVVAAADRDMLPKPVPHSVSQWKSELPLGPARHTWERGRRGRMPKKRNSKRSRTPPHREKQSTRRALAFPTATSRPLLCSPLPVSECAAALPRPTRCTLASPSGKQTERSRVVSRPSGPLMIS